MAAALRTFSTKVIEKRTIEMRLANRTSKLAGIAFKSVSAFLLLAGLGCTPRLKLHPEVTVAPVSETPEQGIVHPHEHEDTRRVASRVGHDGPFVRVRLASRISLQSYADRHSVREVRFGAFACSSDLDWSAELVSGPVFTSTNSVTEDIDNSIAVKTLYRYDVYLPVELERAIRRRNAVQPGSELMAEVSKVEEAGLCLIIWGPKGFGAGFRSSPIEVPGHLSDGMYRLPER